MATKKKKKVNKEKVVEVALDLAVKLGWDNVNLRDIAEESGLSLADLHEYFEDKSDILTALGRIIDRRVLEAVEEFEPELPVRDRLFDVMMERFDILNDYRGGIVAILNSFKFDPKQAIISLPHLCRSMTWMLEAAGLETNGIRGAIKVTGLTGVYLDVLRVWKDDESPDMGKTMAALDKDLGRAESVVNMFGL